MTKCISFLSMNMVRRVPYDSPTKSVARVYGSDPAFHSTRELADTEPTSKLKLQVHLAMRLTLGTYYPAIFRQSS